MIQTTALWWLLHRLLTLLWSAWVRGFSLSYPPLFAAALSRLVRKPAPDFQCSPESANKFNIFGTCRSFPRDCIHVNRPSCLPPPTHFIGIVDDWHDLVNYLAPILRYRAAIPLLTYFAKAFCGEWKCDIHTVFPFLRSIQCRYQLHSRIMTSWYIFDGSAGSRVSCQNRARSSQPRGVSGAEHSEWRWLGGRS